MKACGPAWYCPSAPGVLFLFDFEGQSPGATPTDWSMNQLVPTGAFGSDPSISVSNAKFGTNSIFNSSSGWNLASSLFNLGTGDFQIDFWSFCLNSSTAHQRYMLDFGGLGGNGFSVTANSGIVTYVVGGSPVAIGGTQSDNTFYHNVIQRVNGFVRIGQSGALVGGGIDSRSLSGSFQFMAQISGGGSTGWNGCMDEIRGTTRAADFFTFPYTVPTAAYPREHI